MLRKLSALYDHVKQNSAILEYQSFNFRHLLRLLYRFLFSQFTAFCGFQNTVFCVAATTEINISSSILIIPYNHMWTTYKRSTELWCIYNITDFVQFCLRLSDIYKYFPVGIWLQQNSLVPGHYFCNLLNLDCVYYFLLSLFACSW